LSAGAFGNTLLHGVIVVLLPGSEVTVGFAFLQKSICSVAVFLGIVGLKDQLLVVVESNPLESLDDRASGFFRGALQVSVFNAKQKLSANVTCVKPVEERGASGADVQVAGW
jgi:hypothetical protein